ncbi:hypothetical protein RAMDARK_1719 [Rickettsia amblyommatis str. Darkwater]|nr:hypothetical protein RAMDARK_1719 [Rickettsia amblyommatis str. Darkwater]
MKFKAMPIELYSVVYAAGDLHVYKIVDQKKSCISFVTWSI